MNNLFIKQDYRCHSCGKLIMKGLLVKSGVESKCPRCGEVSLFGDAPILNNYEYFILVTSIDGEIINTSADVSDYTGYPTKNVVGKNIEMFYADKDGIESDRVISSSIKNHAYLRFDTKYKYANGEIASVSIWFKKIKRDGVEYISRTIGRCVRPVVAKEVEEILSGIGESPAGVFSEKYEDDTNRCDLVAEFDINAHIIYVSATAASLHGYRQDEVLGKSVMDFFAIGEHGWNLPRLIALAVRREPFKTVAYTKCKDDSIITTDAIATPFYDDVGNYLGYRLMGWKKS